MKRLTYKPPAAIEMPFGTVSIRNKENAWSGISLFEGEIMKDTTIGFHFAMIDTESTRITPAVNSRGSGYAWGDATVRGCIDGDLGGRMGEYFGQVASVFRCSTPQDYAIAHLARLPGEKIAMVTDGNGNLFWNLGPWIYTNGELHQHYRERFLGAQTALIIPEEGCPRIGALDLDRIPEGVAHAVYGQRLINGGDRVSLLCSDKDTKRPLAAEFAGDFSHIVKLPYLASVNRRIFEANIRLLPALADMSGMSELSRLAFEQDCKNLVAKTVKLDPLIRSMILGERVAFDIPEPENVAIEKLGNAGYSMEEYDLTSGKLRIALKRSTFGHSMVGMDYDGKTMSMLKIYTDFSRKGLMLEQVAELMLRIARAFSMNIKDGLLMSNGGDLRLGQIDGSGKVTLIDRTLNCPDLLYRGREEYGITSAFIFTEKKS